MTEFLVYQRLAISVPPTMIVSGLVEADDEQAAIEAAALIMGFDRSSNVHAIALDASEEFEHEVAVNVKKKDKKPK